MNDWYQTSTHIKDIDALFVGPHHTTCYLAYCYVYVHETGHGQHNEHTYVCVLVHKLQVIFQIQSDHLVRS